jgi:hypothetical protein
LPVKFASSSQFRNWPPSEGRKTARVTAATSAVGRRRRGGGGGVVGSFEMIRF